MVMAENQLHNAAALKDQQVSIHNLDKCHVIDRKTEQATVSVSKEMWLCTQSLEQNRLVGIEQ